MSCNVCNSQNSKILYVKQGMNIMQCNDCSFMFVYPPPSIEKQNEYYNKSYEEGSYKLYSSVEDLKIKTSEKRFDGFSKFSKNGRLLDVGCATGVFLDVCLQKGFHTYGVELSEKAIKQANKKHNIFHGVLEDAKFEDSFFDVVTMFDIIEHVLDPAKTIKEINRILKPGGFVVFTTPNISSWHAKVMRKKWGLITPLEHLSYFSPKTIRLILEKNGFSIVKIRKNTKVFTLNYLIGQAEFFYPSLYKFLKPIKKVLPQGFLKKYRDIYIGEMYAITKKMSGL